MPSYDAWLENLKDLAATEGIELETEKYDYYTYYSRGWSPEIVIDDLVAVAFAGLRG